jgi:hypothetical protein
MTEEPTDEERKLREALRIVDELAAEAAWERYRDTIAVLDHRELGDVRLPSGAADSLSG